jgi:hypothetical protein
MLTATQQAYALTMDRHHNVKASASEPNAYWAADADTLVTWLLANHRVTCPNDDALLERVRQLVIEKRTRASV